MALAVKVSLGTYDMVASYEEDSEVLKMKGKHRKGGKVDMSKGLREWLKTAAVVDSIEEFERKM